MSRIIFLSICLLSLMLPLSAQTSYPTSNIYLFDLEQVSDSNFQFNNPQYLTAFNPNGYNNHPYFFNDSELYISVQLPGMNQTDLYSLNLDEKTKTKVTETPDGEFSPKPMENSYFFSAVRQEIHGQDTLLRLWQFPTDRTTNGKPVFKYIQGIGYYQWLNSYQVAVYMVEKSNTYLGIADIRSDEVTPLATNAGRSFSKLPNENLAYIQRSNNNSIGLIMEYNLFQRGASPQKIIETLPGSQDFALLPDGTFIMARGSKLFKFNRFMDENWIEIADLRYYDIKNITRLAISNSYKIAIVAD